MRLTASRRDLLISRMPAAFLKNLAELNFSRRPMRTALSSRVWRLGRRRRAAQRASIKKARSPRRFTSCACKPARACKAIRTVFRSGKKAEICPRARLCLRGGVLNFIVYFACAALVKFHRGAFAQFALFECARRFFCALLGRDVIARRLFANFTLCSAAFSWCRAPTT